MKKTLNIVVGVASALGIMGTSQLAQAAGFNLDFETDASGNALDAIALDTHGANDRTDIGSLWSSIGIDISTNVSAPLGLFQSNCLPQGGTSNDGFTVPCNSSSSDGDPDLATGDGSYGSITYNTPPQGNVLILEENPGNGEPDDDGGGGTITFDFNRALLTSVKIGQIGLIDDAGGEIVVNFLDGTSYTQEITNLGENDLTFFTIPSDKQVANFSIEFDGSGAISGVVFTEFQAVPEPLTILGAGSAIAFGASFKRKLAKAKKK